MAPRTKAGGSTRIRYPVSPSCKHCPFGVTKPSGFCGAVAKALSGPPGDRDVALIDLKTFVTISQYVRHFPQYGRKAEIGGIPIYIYAS